MTKPEEFRRREFKPSLLAEQVAIVLYGLELIVRRPDIDGDQKKLAEETMTRVRAVFQ
jgi:hypothetical protein